MAEPSLARECDALCERIAALVEEVLADSAAFLVEVQARGARGSRVVDIFVDSEGPLGSDDLTKISRETGFLLDVENAVEGRYTLNVSTPGLDRPLSLPRQYRKNVGRDLRVRYATGEANENAEVVGALLSVADDAIEVAASGSGALRIPFDDVVRAQVQLPW